MARFDWKKIQRWVIGAPRDPMHREQREGMLLVAFLAWIGLGADGLSSANYGPEEAFLALGIHSHLAIYLALATALTVVIICLGYVQVIELFPSGGGGEGHRSQRGEDCVDCYPLTQGPRVGRLDNAAVGNRIAIGKADLDD